MSTTGDHVFAREFFLPNERENLPKVPSCSRCNNEKSALEHYLTSILPFGGRHNSATENLSTMVPKRLERNKKLHEKLANTRSRALCKEPDGPDSECMILPLEGDKYLELFSFITKGLIWYHWKVLITSEYSIATAALTKHGVEQFNKHFMALDSAQRVESRLANNAFSYIGMQGVDLPQISVWYFSVYNGLKVATSNANHSESSTIIGALSGPNKLIDGFKDVFSTAT